MRRGKKHLSSSVVVDTHDPIDAYVGNRLRMKRKLAGLSQSRLGQLVDLTFQQIQKYEWGTNRIGAGRLFRLAQLLNVPVEWFYEGMPPELLNGSGQMPVNVFPNGDDDILCQPETLGLVHAYYHVADRKQRRKFYDLLKAMGTKTQ